MLLNATQKSEEEMTKERLFGWHNSLFSGGRSGIYKILVGQWRKDVKGSMRVVSGGIGREKVHFEAPAAIKIEAEMHRFLEWFNLELKLDPIIKAGIAHFWFITLHPFEDGNGKIELYSGK